MVFVRNDCKVRTPYQIKHCNFLTKIFVKDFQILSVQMQECIQEEEEPS